MNNVKITFITTLPSFWGGSEVLWIRTAELAISKGYRVQVVVYAQKNGFHQSVEKLRNKVFSFVEMQNFLDRKSWFDKVFYSVKNRIFPPTLKKITQFDPDYILISQASNYDAPFHPVLYPFLLSVNRPYYLLSQFNHEHAGLSYEDIQKSRVIFEKATKIFFVSKRNKQVSERQLARRISNSKIIDNPLNLEDTSYIPYLKEVQTIQFASVARFDVNFKGQDILFQVLSYPQWHARDWHLNIYGSGLHEQYLKELSVFYGIENRVNFIGQVEDVRKIWEHNHALLMPSIAEGKPLALEEAMICGRIGIASDVAGNGELIDDSINGYLSSSFFPIPFSETMERAWSNKDKWESMGRLAHEKMLISLDLNPQKTVLEEIVHAKLPI